MADKNSTSTVEPTAPTSNGTSVSAPVTVTVPSGKRKYTKRTGPVPNVWLGQWESLAISAVLSAVLNGSEMPAINPDGLRRVYRKIGGLYQVPDLSVDPGDA